MGAPDGVQSGERIAPIHLLSTCVTRGVNRCTYIGRYTKGGGESVHTNLIKCEKKHQVIFWNLKVQIVT